MIKIEKKQIIKTFLAIPLCILLSCYDLISQPDMYDIEELFVQKIFGRISFYDSSAYFITMQNLVFVILFNLIFSGYIASYFRYSCVYVFSRLKNRRSWYSSRIVELMIYAFIYVTLFLGGNLIVCIHKSVLSLESEAWKTIFLLLFLSFLLVVNTTLAINILSIRWGTTMSFFVIQVLMFLLVLLAIFTCNITWAAVINPVSCLNILGGDARTIVLIIASNIVWSLVIIGFGMRRVIKYDVALFDAELN